MTIHFETESEIPEALRNENPELFGHVAQPGEQRPHKSPVAGSIPAVPIQSEAELQKEIVSFLQEQGYKVLVTGKARLKRNGKDTYVTPYQADGKGFCDIAAFNPRAKNKLLALELKSNEGKLTVEQHEWLSVLKECGFYASVITPSNWKRICNELFEREED